jgi:predicted Kef-type K+ transport protein
LTRFLVKLIMNGIILVPFLYWFTEATVLSSSLTSLGLTVIAYLIGDQLILRASNNLVATLSDAVLAAVYLWMVAAFMNWSFTWGELLLTVAILGVAELFYHRFLGKVDRDSELQKS